MKAVLGQIWGRGHKVQAKGGFWTIRSGLIRLISTTLLRSSKCRLQRERSVGEKRWNRYRWWTTSRAKSRCQDRGAEQNFVPLCSVCQRTCHLKPSREDFPHADSECPADAESWFKSNWLQAWISTQFRLKSFRRERRPLQLMVLLSLLVRNSYFSPLAQCLCEELQRRNEELPCKLLADDFLLHLSSPIDHPREEHILEICNDIDKIRSISRSNSRPFLP